MWKVHQLINFKLHFSMPFFILLIFSSLTLHARANSISPDTIRIEKEVIIYDTVYTYEYIYDTVFVFDSIFVEALQIPFSFRGSSFGIPQNHFPKPLLIPDTLVRVSLPSQRFFAELGSSWFLFQNLHSFPNNSSENFKKDFVSSLKPRSGFAADLSLGYFKNKRWLFKSGISILRFNEDFSFSRSGRVQDTTFLITPSSYYQPISDTVVIYNADALLSGDSTNFVEYIYTSQQLVQTQDTSLEIKDSLFFQQQNAKNTWTYLEIPLIASYRFFQGPMEIDVESGLITGLLIAQQRTLLYPDQISPHGNLIQNHEFRDLSLAVYFGASFSYPITRKAEVIFNPWARVPLINTTRNQWVSSYSFAQGIRVGIRYHF
jgi:hypothetical protein